MTDFQSMARNPKFRCQFEKLLRLASSRGAADLVAERLRAARRVFSDPKQVEQIVEMLEAATKE